MKKLAAFYHSQDHVNFWAIVATFICLLITLSFFFLHYKELPNQIPLFYSHKWGTDQLALLSQFLILPGMIVLISLGNIALSWHLPKSLRILKRTLCLFAFISALLITITALKIIYIFI